MKLIFSLQPCDDENRNIQKKLATGIQLPKGVGKDEAHRLIELVTLQMKKLAIESWEADTEGREFNSEVLG